MIVIMFDQFLELAKVSGARPQRFAAGKVLFRQGDRVRRMYLLANGEAALGRYGTRGAAFTIARYRGPSIVAEASLYSPTYHCEARLQTDATVITLNKRAVLGALTEDSGLAKAWSSYLAQQVQATRARCELLMLKTVAERVDAWLDLQPKRTLPPRGKWHAMAAEIAISPEALYRELAKRRSNDEF